MKINQTKGIQISMGVIVLIFQTSTSANAAFFQGLGSLPNGIARYNGISYVSDISADGSTVVGSGQTSGGLQAYRWMRTTGMVNLGYLPGSYLNYSHANAVSADGSIVFGESSEEAFRWTNAEGLLGLGVPGGAYAVSADGSVVVGYSSSDSDSGASRWTEETGVVFLGKTPGTLYSASNGISADGSVVVGQSSWALQWNSFLWTEESGIVDLGYLPGSIDKPTLDTSNNFIIPFSLANSVSADGLVVVGGSDNSNSDVEAYRWTSHTGMVGLGDFTGGDFFSFSEDVSADGSVIVGYGTSDDGSEAFIWNSTNGMRSLQQLLTNDFGLDLTGWKLTDAKAISDDGQTIAGNGTNPDGLTEAWIANVSTLNPNSTAIPEPKNVIALLALGLAGFSLKPKL